MSDKSSHLSLVVNLASKPPVPETPLIAAIHNAHDVLVHVASSKYLNEIYGRSPSWPDAALLSGGWLRGLSEYTRENMLYARLKGLVETIAPACINGQLPAETGKALTKAESIKVGARRRLLQAAEQLLAADPRELKVIQDRRDTIAQLKAQTDKAWGPPPQSLQRSLFDNA